MAADSRQFGFEAVVEVSQRMPLIPTLVSAAVLGGAAAMADV